MNGLQVVCVKAGNRYGADHVNILHDMVTRNLPKGFAGGFACFTDDDTGINKDLIRCRPLPMPGVEGWFNKLTLLMPGLFPAFQRILYLDLSVAIVGPLDSIARYSGDFAILEDFYRPGGLQSAVMMWTTGGTLARSARIYQNWSHAGFPCTHRLGDQGVIEDYFRDDRTPPDILQKIFPRQIVSYKVHASREIPKDARIVKFHGEPKPDQIRTGWVSHVWKIDGGTTAEFVYETTAKRERIEANIKAAIKRKARWLSGMSPIESGTVLVCAGGPSLTDDLPSIRAHVAAGAEVVAVNGTLRYLMENSITPDAHVICDARPENITFVPRLSWKGERVYCSQCDISVLDAAGENLTLWHPYFDGILDITGSDQEGAYVGGGTTAGLKAVAIAYARGVRKIHLYGFDSCYLGDANHAYPQPMNEGERIIDVTLADGNVFKCAPWMATQAEDFRDLAMELTAQGCELFIHGSGLIPAMAALAEESKMAPDLRANAILARLEGVPEPVVAEIGVFAGDLSKRLLGRRQDLRLFMIDAWGGNQAQSFLASDDFHSSLTPEAQEEYFEHAKAMTSFAGERRTIIRELSTKAAEKIPDQSLDLVFIDADHSYDGCKADIEAYWSKVKPGGIVAGHDYGNDDFKFGPMVKCAVDEFVAAKGLALDLGQNFTWFAVKAPEGALNV